MENNILLQWSKYEQPTTTAEWLSADVLPRGRRTALQNYST